MIAVVVAFMGGPLDGHTRFAPTDSTGQPAPGIRLNAYVWADPDGEPAVYVADYRRTLNPADDGPLWVYLFEPADDGPVLPESTVDALDPSQVDGPGPGR